MGIYADKKSEAHTWFDKLWRNHEERDYYYHRLSKDLGIDYESCHFSTMSVEQINQALVLIKSIGLRNMTDRKELKWRRKDL